MWPEVAVAVFIVLLVLAFITRKNVDIQGVPELPIVQGLFHVAPNYMKLLDFFLETSRKFKFQTWTFKMPFGPRFIVIMRPENVEHVLNTNFKNYSKGARQRRILRDLLGNGIFNADGDLWYRQRKTASHLFSTRIFRETMTPVFQHHCETLLEQLERAALHRTEVEMQRLFMCYTLDSIGEIAFGVTIGALHDPDIPFARAFDRVQTVLDHRYVSPFWPVVERINGVRQQVLRDVAEMHRFCQQLIDRRRADGSFEHREDILSRTMRVRSETGEYLCLNDDAYLKDVLMNFMIAGRDTTAQALTWAIFRLGQNPAAEAAMVREIRAVLGENNVPTFEQATKQMPYTAAVVKETLRLHPSVPKDVREAAEADVLPDGTKVPAGAWLSYQPYVMGHCDALWENAEEFRPQRFVDEPNPSPYKYPVFNAGPRICLGREMAVFEAVMVLAAIYKRYTFRLVANQEITYVPSLTNPTRYGVRVTVHRWADIAI